MIASYIASFRSIDAFSPWDSDVPIREELFSVDRLEQHAETLAAAQAVSAKSRRAPSLVRRLKDNAAVLLQAHRTIATALDEGRFITPAAEWLVDNYHVVAAQVREVQTDLPDGYYRLLPKLADGPFAGYPRVFGLAWAFVAHTDSHFDSIALQRFVHAYQRVQPLTIGELWAIAITLRIVLVENLRRSAIRILAARAGREEADVLADRLLGTKDKEAESVSIVLEPLGGQMLPPALAVQLVQRLRDQDPKVTPALEWLETHLTRWNTSSEAIVREEQHRQGASNLTVRNIITSMRLVSGVNWADLIESVSLVDDILGKGSQFREMDFPTRNLYRSAIEELSRGSQVPETDIATRVLELAATSKSRSTAIGGTSARRTDEPGFYLIADGRYALESTIGFRIPPRLRFRRFLVGRGIGGYVASTIVVAFLLLIFPAVPLVGYLVDGWMIGLLLCLGFIPALDLATALINRDVTKGFSPVILPGMELAEGIPENLGSIVVIPILLTSQAAIAEHIERLEIHYLTSPKGALHFALLSDWKDAATEQTDQDATLLQAAIDGIAVLNRRHLGAGDGRFLLLHRRRLWNETQGRWMGWERKRGKLHELNRLLREAADTSFIGDGGLPAIAPSGIRYVITLDSDTKLPREAVRRLIGKMAHPLNHPSFDAADGRVTEGYGILQPRVTPSLPMGQEGSLFQRIISGPGGIDPYATATSDLYQDLFGEGSFTGKGIYDLDAVDSALRGRVPENAVLSHDLFEGVFSRAGLASDIEVVEEFPARYDVAAARQHRWVRGDWQLLPWLVRHICHGKTSRKDALPAMGFWKMADNLRRSLTAPAVLVALIVGWMLPLPAAAIWSLFLLATIAIPPLVPLFAAIIPQRLNVTPLSHLRALGGDLRLTTLQIISHIIFLPHQAWLMCDAIIRTLYRVYISRQNLLEWMTAAQATIGRTLNVIGFARQMAGSIALAIAAALLVGLTASPAWPIAVPVILCWALSPTVAYWISRSPRDAGRLSISPSDAQTLRLIARRTWRYFETFVTVDDCMLPPDNFQEDPKPALARRTSPTNLGLYLLSTVSARDFGWLGLRETADRLSATLATMESLEKYRGHFYNWYDTHDLRPLDPKYISTVDSGNLAGHLITLANACRLWREQPHLDIKSLFRGLSDDLELALSDLKQARTQADAFALLATHLQQGLAEPENGVSILTGMLPLTSAARSAAVDAGESVDVLYWLDSLQRAIRAHLHDLTLSAEAADACDDQLAAIEEMARRMAFAMNFSFLLDKERELLSIGYLVGEGKLDPSCYDLLASEARLSSLFAIAKGDIPTSHWFRLGRTVTPIGSGAALISWSGSMFEYLMPSLIMRAPAGTLLERTNRLVVHRQIHYGDQLGLPWGISESAYNVRDLEFTYQYSPFGVPSLALKRGLGENAVIAPYATALALMVDPSAALRNFARLAKMGGLGRYGFYEALDFTRKRMPVGEEVAIVRAFMSHHQGMSIVAVANALFDGAMRSRFHAEPIIQASELLLQERTPRDVALERPKIEEIATLGKGLGFAPAKIRRFSSPHGPLPETHLLSNGRYAVMLTSAGSGYSRWKDLAVTRWREDVTRDDWGSYIFLRDTQSGKSWSASYQPSGAVADRYRVAFSEDRAEIQRRDGTLTTTLEVVVSGEDDAEVRRLSITNTAGQAREIEVTSYLELVLAPQAADAAHPAFSKMFVQTEYLAHLGALIATRRRRAPSEPEIWAAQIMVVEGETLGDLQIETDRMAFLGRGRNLRRPIAMTEEALSGTVGTVLDPIFAMRRRLRIDGRSTVRVAYWTIVASSRQKLLDLIDRHQDANAFQRAATLAWTQAQVQLRHLNIDPEEANTFQQLASHLLYANNALRPAEETIRRGSGSQSSLWQYGISGDAPIVLLRIDDVEDIGVVQQALRAHEYWRMKQISVDLVIINERATSYTQDLQLAIEAAVRASQSRPTPGEAPGRGSVFALRADIISIEMRGLLAAVARILLVARRGKLSAQLDRIKTIPEPAPRKIEARPPIYDDLPDDVLDTTPLEFFNGLGGFSDGGREYTIALQAGQSTPAPWINVIANPSFGFNVAAEGTGNTWSINSREHQLTPWSNDPVSDPAGEVLYICDEDSGEVWGPTALPVRRDGASYTTRHGRGYSRFENTTQGIAADLVQFVPLTDSIKISRLTLTNTTDHLRHLSVTAYVEWILGAQRGATAPFIVTTLDSETGAIFAQNSWNAAFKNRVAFIDLGRDQTEWTADRREFLGRNGTLQAPAALTTGLVLSGNVGAGYDPCSALKTDIELPSGSSREIIFVLGDADNEAAARELVNRYRSVDLDAVLKDIARHWDDVLGKIQIKTPDRAMDIMLNGWTLYQTLACRFWARSGFYQASGAFGFRDQLQDGMALAVTRPDLTRAHLLHAAGRQFREGDLQHWWLPPLGQGVRTRISDDRIWLAYTAAHYIETTGDRTVLEEILPFLDGPALAAGEHDSFFQPMASDDKASLYEHCALALDRSLEVGAHGLPLIGTGDWNDGMNRVGEAGKGESVWLGWFLYTTLLTFADLAFSLGDIARAGNWRSHAKDLQIALEAQAWDGNWYRRGYFDDGTPLGSALSAECQIDSIAQSWAVLSGAAAPGRAQQAMASLHDRLIDQDDKLALLFAPPFDQSMPEPGYIKGYPPGIRENGGQYTHAATWTVLALTKLDDGDGAVNLFNLLNPINHANTKDAALRYKVEPYAIPADVYSVAPHVGRGGWTWYTGSAGWLYRAGIEGILGLRQRGTKLLIEPCIPKDWPGFEVTFKFKSATYNIVVERSAKASSDAPSATLDGQILLGQPVQVPLTDDGRSHEVCVFMS